MSVSRRVGAGALAAALLALGAVLLLGRGGGGYHLRLTLANASGLQQGSPVTIGGAKVGKVSLSLGRGDVIHVDAKINRGKTVPRDARVAISAVNFLGTKQVAFIGGDAANPAPSGYTFPAARVSVSTDLDQVLDTLDPDTRARLGILVNEAGLAVVGRKLDISHFVQEAPTTVAEGSALLDRLTSDNHTLSDLVTSSDRLVDTTTHRRAQLVQLIGTLGQTSRTVETKRAQLGATLAQAPGTLATLRGFLGDLQATTVPLGPAARQLTAASPPLQQTLSEVDGFRQAADPTLKTATKVAPTLSKLATAATPVVRKAVPTVQALLHLTQALPPVGTTLDHSADNLVATLENWSQAIQLRDGVSHIFRGEATFSPDLITSAIDRMSKPADRHGARTAAKHPSAPTAAAPATPSLTRTPSAPSAPVQQATDAVKGVVGGVSKTVQGAAGQATGAVGQVVHPPAGAGSGSGSGSGSDGDAGQDLLDYLLGA